jgi:hypothetical protein
MAQDEFVDLYALLDLEPTADVATVRKQLVEKYVDAQNNLDHRNPTKRLQYQQLYEVYLPQARHLLLDTGRRSEYDRYLTAFRSGTPLNQVAARTPESMGQPASSGIPEMDAGQEQVDPEKLAVEREHLWDRWKSSLKFEEGDSSSASGASAGTTRQAPPLDASFNVTAEPEPEAPVAPPKPQMPEKTAAQLKAEAASSARAAAKARAAAQEEQEEAERRQREEREHNRMLQREQIIGNTAQNSGLIWTIVGGGATLVIASILLLVGDGVLKNKGSYPLGMSSSTFTTMGFILVVLLAVLGAWLTGKTMRAKTLAKISSMSLEELQRRAG